RRPCTAARPDPPDRSRPMRADANPFGPAGSAPMCPSTWRYLSAVLATLGAVPAFGQTYPLAENPGEGDCFRITTETQVAGSLKVARDGKQVTLKIAGKNEHVF